MTVQPALTLCIINYNSAEHLRRFAALQAQPWEFAEILVTNNAFEDPSAEVVGVICKCYARRTLIVLTPALMFLELMKLMAILSQGQGRVRQQALAAQLLPWGERLLRGNWQLARAWI